MSTLQPRDCIFLPTDATIAAHHTCGQRFLERERSPEGYTFHLWDFNTYTVPRRKEHGRSKVRERFKAFLSTSSKGGDVKFKTAEMTEQDAPNVHCVSKPTIIKDKDIFRDEKVSSSLPYRRSTHGERYPQLTAALMDDERILLWRVSQNFRAVRPNLT